MTSLRLFSLPQLVCIRIINQMNPAEQIVISQCSRKAYAHVKRHRNKNDIVTLRKLGSSYLYLTSQFAEETKPLQLGVCCNVPEKNVGFSTENHIRFQIESHDDCDCMNTYWRNKTIGLRIFLELLCDLFPIDVHTLRIDSPSDIWCLEWFKNHQKTIKKVDVYSPTINFNNDLKEILLNCEAEVLNLKVSPISFFEIENFHQKFGLFNVQMGNWVTVSNLMTLDCIEIRVVQSFSCSEVNQFLKHWINGGSPRLQFLIIGVREYNHNEVFADIQNHITWIPGNRSFTSQYKSTFTFNGRHLQRNDGVTASIQHFRGKMYLGVWPDITANVEETF